MKKTTKRVEPSFIEGKEPIAVGYKIFEYDWKGYGGYSYADENGNVEGGVHTVTGDLSKCGWGLHYCKNPVDCMRYKDIIQWNKFALVEAYDENIDCEDDGKSVCRAMLIKKILTFDEMVNACKVHASGGSGIRNGHGISESYGISIGYGIRNGYGISDGSGISAGYGISAGSGVSNAKHCLECEGISHCLLCYRLEGARLMLFNKPVSEERFNEVSEKLGSWYPDFTNIEELRAKYGNGEWEAIPVAEIRARTAKEAYAEMPDELRAYIKSLPEYDDEIFRFITGVRKGELGNE